MRSQEMETPLPLLELTEGHCEKGYKALSAEVSHIGVDKATLIV